MKDILPLLEKLAEKLGTTADHLWSALLRQATLSFWSDVVLCLFLVFAVIVWIKTLKYAQKNWQKIYDNDREIFYQLGLGVSGVVLLIFILGVFFSVPYILSAGFNREYWALREVLGAIRGN